jgi:hypothetical protein
LAIFGAGGILVRGRGLSIRTFLTVAALTSVAATSGCMGGCYNHAGPVSVDPATPCLTLFAGQNAHDDVVCAWPQLGGQNGCADTLTLPPLDSGGSSFVVAPGATIAYPVGDSSRPGVVVTPSGGTTTYVLAAMLGATAVTITIPVH